VEEFGTIGGTERVEAFRKSLLQLMQGRHRVNDRFEDLRSVPERQEALPGTRRAGEGLGTALDCVTWLRRRLLWRRRLGLLRLLRRRGGLHDSPPSAQSQDFSTRVAMSVSTQAISVPCAATSAG